SAYSYVNSLCSAMQAYLTLGSAKHLRAASNAFEMLKAQSFATGGWGPDEQLRAPGSPDVADSLTKTHNSFETPCGSYAHFKLTRYLLCVTRDSRYGDSMERVMYNTILGIKPLLADGSTFYYSDYNFHARKIYKEARWPCCSGTMPQVAADYRINAYFFDDHNLYVNLFIPSSVRWTRDGARIALTQKTEYPFDSTINFELTASKAADFTLHLRIPGWAGGATISVNGKTLRASEPAGQFAAIRRTWKSGDRIDLHVPLKTRLESIDSRHPKAVALLSGPLVLFAIANNSPTMTSAQLLAAKKSGAQSWQADTAATPLTLLPFMAIDNQQYSTYVVTI
ncbi:MAG TPA: beta-L-arabinofuranosidase domain-containing protein, partial [Candidatus Acidoferrum sp.]